MRTTSMTSVRDALRETLVGHDATAAEAAARGDDGGAGAAMHAPAPLRTSVTLGVIGGGGSTRPPKPRRALSGISGAHGSALAPSHVALDTCHPARPPSVGGGSAFFVTSPSVGASASSGAHTPQVRRTRAAGARDRQPAHVSCVCVCVCMCVCVCVLSARARRR